MATLFRVDGSESEHAPTKGDRFTIDEIGELVGGSGALDRVSYDVGGPPSFPCWFYHRNPSTHAQSRNGALWRKMGVTFYGNVLRVPTSEAPVQ